MDYIQQRRYKEMTENNQITVEYYVTKNSTELEKVHPYNPVSRQLYDKGVAYIERKSQHDVVTIQEWLTKQTRLHNSKRSSQEKSEFRFLYHEGTYLSEEEE